MNQGRLAVEAQGVRAGYGGRDALRGLSIKVPEGSIYALLGRNGAGKSTLIRCLLGQMKPREGRALLLGEDAWRRRAALMDRVGVVPEEPDLPPAMRVAQIEAFCAALYASWDGTGFAERLDRFRLDRSALAGSLSRGQKTRLALALALAPEPELLVLDDPTLGLDPVARRSFYEDLAGVLAERPMSILLATHDLAGVEGFADRIGILKDGRLLLDEGLEELKARFRRIRWSGDPPAPGPFAPMRIESKPWGMEALVAKFDAPRLPAGMEAEPLALEDLFIALVDAEQEVLA